MRYLTSRDWYLPEGTDPLWLGEVWFFNMWTYQWWPYRELAQDDTLFLFDRKREMTVWEASVSRVQTRRYSSHNDAGDSLDCVMPSPVDRSQRFFRNAPQCGFLLAFECRAKSRIDRPRPQGRRLPRLGWIRGEAELRYWI